MAPHGLDVACPIRTSSRATGETQRFCLTSTHPDLWPEIFDWEGFFDQNHAPIIAVPTFCRDASMALEEFIAWEAKLLEWAFSTLMFCLDQLGNLGVRHFHLDAGPGTTRRPHRRSETPQTLSSE
jgi:hypothetical protein